MRGTFKRGFNRGFTLVELMVVIAIIGVIFTIAVPNFASMQRRARIKAAVQELAQDLRQIRERALSTSIIHTIFFEPAQRKYIVRAVTPNGVFEKEYLLGQTTGGQIGFGCASGVSGHPPEGWVNAPANNGIDFPPYDILNIDNRGGANRGVIYLTDGRESYAIGINSLGRVKIYKYGNGLWR